MLTVPNKIAIGSIWVNICLHENMSRWSLGGYVDPSEHILLIDQRQNNEQRLDTLIHEVFHMIREEYCADWSDEDKEDRLVQRTTNGLLQFFSAVGIDITSANWDQVPVVRSVTKNKLLPVERIS